MRRALGIGAGFTVTLILVAAMSFVLGSRQKTSSVPPTSAQLQAPSTVTVTQEVIQENYVFSGELGAQEQAQRIDATGVVTGLPVKQGKRPVAGRPLLEINGRPLLAMDIPFPLWRDIGPKTSGKDVRVLQQALRDLGFYTGPITGTYGDLTAEAVRRLYADNGYSPVTQDVPAETDEAAAEKDEETSISSPPRRIATIPMTEIAAVGDGRWRLDLAGATVGTTLGGDTVPSLNGSGTMLSVADEGRLTQILTRTKRKKLLIASGSSGTETTVSVISHTRKDDESVLVIRPRSGSLDSGPVSGSVVLQTTDTPVLALPVTALSPTVEGTSSVRLMGEAGTATEVEVTVGLRGDRLVEISGPGIVAGSVVELPR